MRLARARSRWSPEAEIAPYGQDITLTSGRGSQPGVACNWQACFELSQGWWAEPGEPSVLRRLATCDVSGTSVNC